MIQTRRSVSSSPSSESENNDMHSESKRQQIQSHTINTANKPSNELGMPSTIAFRANELVINENIQDILSFSVQQQSIQHPDGQLNQFNIPNENGPVSLFPPSGNAQIPFPSPGAAMFPPTFVNAFSSVATSQSTSKHMETLTPNSTLNSPMNYPSSLCAAFTSSSRNIALTNSVMAPLSVQSDVLTAVPPNGNNSNPISQLATQPQPTHTIGNINNNNINSNKPDLNRKSLQKNLQSTKMRYYIHILIILYTFFIGVSHVQPVLSPQTSTQSLESHQSQKDSLTSSRTPQSHLLPDSTLFNLECMSNDLTSNVERNISTDQSSKRPTRLNAQQAQSALKSPSKSPGKSPSIVRQKSESSRGRSRGARNSSISRAGTTRISSTATRGRGRGRAPLVIPMGMCDENRIISVKLF